MKAEQLWAQNLAAKGCTLPRGKAFKVASKTSKAPAPKVSAVKVESKPAVTVTGLSEAQQGAMAELASGDWVAAADVAARKQTLNALVKKGLVESREQGDKAEYKLA